MKIGDKVRFLSETGGGTVAGFQGRNIVLVEDADGFRIPTALNDVVVVDERSYETGPMLAEAAKGLGAPRAGEPAGEPAPEPVGPGRDEPEEREGGDALSVYLAFVPADVRELSRTGFEAYIVNDSNYFVSFAYMGAEGAGFALLSAGEVEPNTKLFIGDLSREDISRIDRVAVQLIAFKRARPFQARPAVDARFRVDATKFYKLHSFRENDFFERQALLYPIVENDRPVRPLVVDPDALKREMMRKVAGDSPKAPARAPVAKDDPNAPVVVDLHASELLDTTSGMSPGDILEYQLGVFRKTMDRYMGSKGRRIVFIHGKGEGVLRRAIINDLKYRYRKCTHQDASFREYGFGATQVTIR